MVIAGLMRTCGRGEHHRDLSALDSGQMSIAVDPSAPFPSSAPAPAPVDTAPPTEAAALQTAAPDTAAGPGFDCAGAASETLKLICATPELAAADRTLAAAYQHALAASADPDALRDSERAWLVARDGAPADVDQLRGLYAERIRALGGAPSSSGADPF
jgi:uncharacterized protein YecT (DUF1311 family)